MPPPPAAGLIRIRFAPSGLPAGDRAGGVEQRRVRLVVAVVAGHDRDPEADRQPAGRRLVAHRPDRARRWPDPADPGGLDGLGEAGVLGQEAEPGWSASAPAARAAATTCGMSSRSTAGEPSCSRNHDPDPKAIRRSPDPRGDLAPVRDEQGPDRVDRSVPARRRPAALARPAGPLPVGKRVNRVRRDTPPTTNSPSRQFAAGDPALDGSGRGPDPLGGLARRQLIGHRDAIVAHRRRRDGRRPPLSRDRQACGCRGRETECRTAGNTTRSRHRGRSLPAGSPRRP